jgi:raffinose/stachyose/melibiose transport system permease protein
MRRYTGKTLVLEIVMISAALVFFFPAYILINIAFKSSHDATPDYLPTAVPTLENLVRVWNDGVITSALVNSLIVTGVSVAVLVTIAALASYPLARVTRAWSRAMFFFFLLGLLLPFQLGLIPLYTTVRDLNLLGSLLSVIIFNIGIHLPFAVFLYTTFLRGIPEEYEEAAAIDGASRFTTFHQIIFPLLRPVTGSVIILSVVFVYNDFFTPLLYLSGSGNQTAPVALSSYVGQFASDWNSVFAGLVVSSLPVLVAYFIMQRSVIKGFGGGLKG